MLRKLLLTSLLCGLALAIVLPGYIATRPGDAGGPDDADLAISLPRFANPQNGIRSLYEATRATHWSEDDDALHARAIDLGDWSRESIESVLARNVEALGKLDLALAAGYFGLPTSAPGEEEHVPEIPLETNHLIKLLELQSFLAARRGDWEAGFSAAIKILRLAQKIERAERAVLTTTMMSVGYRADGLALLRKMTRDAPIDLARALRWTQSLASYPSDSSAWKRMWSSEYQQWKALLRWITRRAESEKYARADGGPETALSPGEIKRLNRHSDETLQVFARLTRNYQRASEGDCTKLDSLSQLAPLIAAPTGPEDTKAILFKINTPDYREFFLARCAQDTALAATQTLIGLKAFRDQNGYLPLKLEEIVPLYLATVPRDAFDGNPIRYSRSRRLIYSIGSDGVEWSDSNGDEDAYRQPTFAIDF